MRTALSVEFIEQVLGQCSPADWGPYELTDGYIAGRRRTTTRGFSGFNEQVDVFCRFANAAGSPEALLAFANRWGLPNGKPRQRVEEVAEAAHRMNSRVFDVERLNASAWGPHPDFEEVKARTAFRHLERATTPVLDGLFTRLGPPRLWFDESDGAVEPELGWRLRRPLDITTLEVLHLQLARAVITGELIRRCRDCNGAFIYQEPRPNVKGVFRREADFCTWQHAKNFGDRERRRRKGRGTNGKRS